MSELSAAIERFNQALERLSGALEAGAGGHGGGRSNGADKADFEAIIKDRDRLRAELDAVNEARKADEKLRAEAADALDNAIEELRGALGE